MSEDVVLRLVVLEVVDALLSDESLLDHTKERLRSAVGNLANDDPMQELSDINQELRIE